jgi:adenosylcobinamide kinase/adenosylcobinamide-phosphate guanylyltransferase
MDFQTQSPWARDNAAMIELILGGARSGKSALAEKRATESGLRVTYLATAEAHDTEMTQRIAHHRARRPTAWGLAEEPLQLAATLQATAASDCCLLVDCLTLWLSNLLFADDDGQLLAQETAALLDALPMLPGRVILVSNEVGLGIIPLGEITRRFVDEAGRLNQCIAAVAQRVTFVAAGFPLELKSPAA